MKSTFAAKLLADLRECRALYPYADPAIVNSPHPQLLAGRVNNVRIDAAAWLWDFRFGRVPTQVAK